MIKKPFRNTRRRFVKNSIVAGSLSPMALKVVQPVLAAGAANKPKVVFVYIPDGVSCPKFADGSTNDSINRWHPNGLEVDTGKGYSLVNNPTLNLMTEAFSPIKEHVTFLQGLDMKLGRASHHGGARKVLTANGADSLDVALGQQPLIGGLTPLRHLNLGCMANFKAGNADHVHYQNGAAVTPVDDPVAAFNHSYGISHADAAHLATQYGSPTDIVSHSFREIEALMTHDLGADERIKLQMQLDTLNELRKKIDTFAGANIGNFSALDSSKSVIAGADTQCFWRYCEDDFAATAELQTGLITQLLASGMTRVASLQLSHTMSNIRNHHAISHHFGQTWVDSLNEFYRVLTKLVAAMKATPDGSSHLLDNTLIFGYSCLSDGKLHDHRDMPFFLIGGHNFGIQGNRKLRYDLNAEGDGRGVDHTKLLVSIAKYMGHNIDKFGTNPVSGELPGLYG